MAVARVVSGGTLWAWGFNADGQLGDGTTTTRSSPVQIGTLTTWASVASGWAHCLARKTDGTIWGWGWNQYGTLGQGNTTNKSSPVQIGTLTTWASVENGNATSMARKTDGTLWAWGYNGTNSAGMLGLGDLTHRSSPVQVGALTTWGVASVGNGGVFHSCTTKTDGTIWTSGRNDDGRLGDGTTTNRSSPVQVGTLTTWASVVGGGGHCLARKTDGTIWGWGANNNGQLGDGTATNRSNPVQIGALTTWTSIGGGSDYSLALKN